MNPVFLSASIPDPKRDPKYFATADVVAIRDAVTALVEVVLPETKLYFGGHPAITPLVRRVGQRLNLLDKVALFQSREFEGNFPTDNDFFPDLRLSDNLDEMRRAMLDTDRFSAAFFIGGMEGVEQEWTRVRASAKQRGIHMVPVTSTGGAALLLSKEEDMEFSYPADLRNALRSDINYAPFFRKLLQISPLGGNEHDPR
jgi:hypothetical protein